MTTWPAASSAWMKSMLAPGVAAVRIPSTRSTKIIPNPVVPSSGLVPAIVARSSTSCVRAAEGVVPALGDACQERGPAVLAAVVGGVRAGGVVLIDEGDGGREGVELFRRRVERLRRRVGRFARGAAAGAHEHERHGPGGTSLLHHLECCHATRHGLSSGTSSSPITRRA